MLRVFFYYPPRRLAPPAAPPAPLLAHQPPVAPSLNQAPPQDDLNELPVNPNFTLDDALDTSSSADNAQYSSSTKNSDALVVSHATPPLCDPSSCFLTRSRTPSPIYSSSDLNSSISTFFGFDSRTLSRADRCLNRPSYSPQGGSTLTPVTYTHPSTLSCAPLPTMGSPPPSFHSRKPISPISRTMSPRPRILTQTSHMASSTPLHHSHPQFESHSHFYPPPPSRSSLCDSSAQPPNAELTLQERYPGVIIPPIYNRTSQQSSQSFPRDTSLSQKQKNFIFSQTPVEIFKKTPKFDRFWPKK